MPKAYWIAQIDVNNPEAYKDYVAATTEPFRKYGARFLARGGKCEVMEGKGRGRNVIIEFADYATAVACYRSPEYAKAAALRQKASTGDLLIVEGYDA